MPFNKCFPCLRFKQNERVTKVDLSNTVLSEAFPDVWQHEQSLEELQLTNTHIDNLPPQLFYCQSLRVLAVNNNNLKGIPDAIGTLRQLQRFDAARNLLSNIPESIKSCRNLTHLDLSCNHLQRLPNVITTLINLQELILNETYLEFLPANFGRLVNLRILELRLNNLITLPKSLARLVNLQRIDIGGNEFEELPEVVGELKQLRELWIDFNQIRRISPNIAKLRDLQHFEANSNLLTCLPNEIGHWRNIEVLSLSQNSLQTFPFNLGLMKFLVTLKCESNELVQLPDSISQLEYLEELVVSHNRLQRLPTTIGMLRKLRFLFADDNQLCEIPAELCSCSQLSVLSVNRNRLTELPQNIGHLLQLRVLNLVNNYLDTLPVSVLRLVNLTSLWISDNQSQPLVPLQYADMNTKTELTCFMLPQGDHSALAAGGGVAEGNVYTNDGGDCGEIDDDNQNVGLKHYQFVDGVGGVIDNYDPIYAAHYQQQHQLQLQQQHLQQHQLQPHKNYAAAYTTTASNSSSPNKRICFAEKATILSAQDQQINLVDCKNNNQQSRADDDECSLTASDKSSRVMLQTEAQLEQEMLGRLRLIRSPTPYPKELRLMAKYMRHSGGQAQRPVADAALSADPAYVKQTTNACQTDEEGDQGDSFVCARPNLVSLNGGSMVDANDLAALDVHSLQHIQLQQQQQQQQYVPPQMLVIMNDVAATGGQTQYDSISHNASIASASYYNGMVDMPPTALPLGDEQHVVDGTASLLYTANGRQPPPYHIARVFSKKSPADLNDYATLHLNYQQQQQQQYAQYTVAAATPMSHESQYNGVSVGDDEPLNAGEGQSAALTTNAAPIFQTVRSEQQQLVRKTPWLFGVHKNPSVIQVTLKWEHELGFVVDELNNRNGVYVTQIMPRTPAAQQLCLHDKLLEIDAYDLAEMSLQETRHILANVGNVVNIMLSRIPT